MDVIDIWRLYHSLESHKPKLIMRRLNFFLVSFSLIEIMDKSKIRLGLTKGQNQYCCRKQSRIKFGKQLYNVHQKKVKHI